MWKKKKQSSPLIESQVSAIKRQLRSLPFVKVTLTRSSSAPKNPTLLPRLVSLSCYRVSLENAKDEGLKGVICHLIF